MARELKIYTHESFDLEISSAFLHMHSPFTSTLSLNTFYAFWSFLTSIYCIFDNIFTIYTHANMHLHWYIHTYTYTHINIPYMISCQILKYFFYSEICHSTLHSQTPANSHLLISKISAARQPHIKHITPTSQHSNSICPTHSFHHPWYLGPCGSILPWPYFSTHFLISIFHFLLMITNKTKTLPFPTSKLAIMLWW